MGKITLLQAVDWSLQFPYSDGGIADSVPEAHAALCAASIPDVPAAAWRYVKTLDFAIGRASDGPLGFFKKLWYAWKLEPYAERYTRRAELVPEWREQHGLHEASLYVAGNESLPDAAIMVALAEILLRIARLSFFDDVRYVVAARTYVREAKHVIANGFAPCDAWSYVRAELVEARIRVLQGNTREASELLGSIVAHVLGEGEPWLGFADLTGKQKHAILHACIPLLFALDDDALAERSLGWVMHASPFPA